MPALVEWINAQHGTCYVLRVQDLMTLLMYAYCGPLVGKPVVRADEVRSRIWDYALSVRGPGEMVVCMVSGPIGLVEWSVRHSNPEDVTAFLETGRRFLADLEPRGA